MTLSKIERHPSIINDSIKTIKTCVTQLTEIERRVNSLLAQLPNPDSDPTHLHKQLDECIAEFHIAREKSVGHASKINFLISNFSQGLTDTPNPNDDLVTNTIALKKAFQEIRDRVFKHMVETEHQIEKSKELRSKPPVASLQLGQATAAVADRVASMEVKPLAPQVVEPVLVDEHPLFEAARQNQLDTIRAQIENGLSINATDKEGMAALHHAISKGHYETVHLLLELGANIEAKNKSGQTPLFFAAEQTDTKILELLLARGAKVNETDASGFSPLTTASFRGQEVAVKLLLDHNARVNTKSFEDGFTPLHAAVLGGHENVACCLIEHGADVNCRTKDGSTPLSAASNNNLIGVTKLLIAKGASVNTLEKSYTPAFTAALLGHLDMAGLLLQHGGSLRPPSSEDRYDQQCQLLNLISEKRKGWLEIYRFLRSNDPLAINEAKELNNRQLLAHINDIGGETPLQVQGEKAVSHFRLEGQNATGRIWRQIIKSLPAFNEELHDVIPHDTLQSLMQILEYAAKPEDERVSVDAMFQLWEKDNPVLVNTGANDHHASLILWDKFGVMCERALEGGIGVYPIDKKLFLRIGKSAIRRVSELKSSNFEEYIQFIQYGIRDALDSRRAPIAFPLPRQAVGNCSWANSESVVLAFITLAAWRNAEVAEKVPLTDTRRQEIINEQTQVFLNWRAYTKSWLLMKYLSKKIASSSQFEPDFKLLEEAKIRSAPPPEAYPKVKEKYEQMVILYDRFCQEHKQQ